MITEKRLWIPCSDCGALRMQEHLQLIADNGEGERARYVCDPGCGVDRQLHVERDWNSGYNAYYLDECDIDGVRSGWGKTPEDAIENFHEMFGDAEPGMAAMPQAIPSYREIGVLVAIIGAFVLGTSIGYYIAADRAEAMWKSYAAEVNR